MTQSAEKKKLAHAYLFAGPPEVGKKTLAMEFVKWLLCADKRPHPDHLLIKKRRNEQACGQCKSCLDIQKNQHPDVFILQPRQEEKQGVSKTFEIGIEEIKNLQHRLSLFPYSAEYKAAMIDGAEWLTREAANSFLKTLEEPAGRSLIIFISSAWQSLLPTIISRCQLIKFLAVPAEEIIRQVTPTAKVKKAELEKIIRLAGGRPGRVIKLLHEPSLLKERQAQLEIFKKVWRADLVWRLDLARQLAQDVVAAREILSQWLLWWRDKILQINGLPDLMTEPSSDVDSQLVYPKENLLTVVREIQKTQAILANPSFNARLALEVLMLKI